MEDVGPQTLNATHTAMETHQEAHQRAVKLYKYICFAAVPLDDANANIMNSRRPPSRGFFKIFDVACGRKL